MAHTGGSHLGPACCMVGPASLTPDRLPTTMQQSRNYAPGAGPSRALWPQHRVRHTALATADVPPQHTVRHSTRPSPPTNVRECSGRPHITPSHHSVIGRFAAAGPSPRHPPGGGPPPPRLLNPLSHHDFRRCRASRRRATIRGRFRNGFCLRESVAVFWAFLYTAGLGGGSLINITSFFHRQDGRGPRVFQRLVDGKTGSLHSPEVTA
jgi:hypothetical protein